MLKTKTSARWPSLTSKIFFVHMLDTGVAWHHYRKSPLAWATLLLHYLKNSDAVPTSPMKAHTEQSIGFSHQSAYTSGSVSCLSVKQLQVFESAMTRAMRTVKVLGYKSPLSSCLGPVCRGGECMLSVWLVKGATKLVWLVQLIERHYSCSMYKFQWSSLRLLGVRFACKLRRLK